VYDTFQPGNSGGDEADFLPVFRVPDDWELKILALGSFDGATKLLNSIWSLTIS